MIGQSNPLAIACIIGLTSWMNIAKVVRTEVRQIQNSEYILAAKLMGGRFFYISAPPSAAQFYFLHHVYGGHKHRLCHRHGIHA